MTKAMPFLQKAILLSYDPRRFGLGVLFCRKKPHTPSFQAPNSVLHSEKIKKGERR